MFRVHLASTVYHAYVNQNELKHEMECKKLNAHIQDRTTFFFPPPPPHLLCWIIAAWRSFHFRNKHVSLCVRAHFHTLSRMRACRRGLHPASFTLHSCVLCLSTKCQKKVTVGVLVGSVKRGERCCSPSDCPLCTAL